MVLTSSHDTLSLFICDSYKECKPKGNSIPEVRLTGGSKIRVCKGGNMTEQGSGIP